MQFNIRALLGLMVVVSVLCGVIFAAPPVVAVPILCTILWVCPALWVNGIIYGRGAWRPFFIGGLMAGLMPHVIAAYISLVTAITAINREPQDLIDASSKWPNVTISVILLGPGLFALLGGLTGVWVYWMFQPDKLKTTVTHSAIEPPKVDEYVIVSGRLTAVPPRQTQAAD